MKINLNNPRATATPSSQYQRPAAKVQTSFRQNPNDSTIMLVEILVDGWCLAQVSLPITTALRLLEPRAYEVMAELPEWTREQAEEILASTKRPFQEALNEQRRRVELEERRAMETTKKSTNQEASS